MNRLYLASTLAWNETMAEIVRRAARLGAHGLEIWAEQVWNNGDDPLVVRATADSLGMHRTVHGPSWDLNLCSVDRRMLEASRERTKAAIVLASDLGARLLVVHPGRMSLDGHFRDYHLRELKNSYRQLCSFAAGRGILIGLEAMEQIPKELLCDPVSVNRFVGELRAGGVDNLGVVVDVAHLTTLSDDPLPYLAEFSEVVELHLSNVKPPKLHTPLDDGIIDFHSLLPELERRNELPIVVEGLSSLPGLSYLDRAVSAYRAAEA